MWPNPQFLVDLVTFAEEILNGKFHFFCAVKYIWFKKKIIEVITKEQQELQENAKIYISREMFDYKYAWDKKYYKVRDHRHYTGEYRVATHSTCNITYSVPEGIAIIFHNGWNYDYHFTIKELAEEF